MPVIDVDTQCTVMEQNEPEAATPKVTVVVQDDGSEVKERRSTRWDGGAEMTWSATVRADCVGSALPSDPAEKYVPRRARIAIFFLLCQGVQMFMSYDGGSTPASVDVIQQEVRFTAGELGLLGSIDKIGQVCLSILWGRALQCVPVKLLLLLGLGLNTVSTILFGLLKNKEAMFACKFFNGASESLQGIWSTVWTVTMAPPEYKTMWLGLGAVSAGLGNGIGTGVAGFGTANGLPYSFSYMFQGGILATLWLVNVFLPGRWLRMEIPEVSLNIDPEGNPIPEGELEDPSTLAQMKSLCQNKVYMWSSVAIALCMYSMSGIQFLWVRVFTEVWGLDKNWVTLAFLIVTGAGGGIGIAFGPAYIDRRGGYGTSAGVVSSLRSLRWFSVATALSGILGLICVYGKLRSKDSGYWGGWGDHWLWLCWIAISMTWITRNASVPAQCGINVEVVPGPMRTFASGLSMTLRNILGQVCGPLVPGLVMDWVGQAMGWQLSDPRTPDWLLGTGLASVFVINLLDFLVLGRAIAGANAVLAIDQGKAMEQLRDALRQQDIAALEKAVMAAKAVMLHMREDGEAVVGMANEAIGAFNALGGRSSVFQRNFTLTATREELQERIKELETEVERLRAENAKLTQSLLGASPSASNDAPALRRRPSESIRL